jgi:hypothetical protein
MRCCLFRALFDTEDVFDGTIQKHRNPGKYFADSP